MGLKMENLNTQIFRGGGGGGCHEKSMKEGWVA